MHDLGDVNKKYRRFSRTKLHFVHEIMQPLQRRVAWTNSKTEVSTSPVRRPQWRLPKSPRNKSSSTYLDPQPQPQPTEQQLPIITESSTKSQNKPSEHTGARKKNDRREDARGRRTRRADARGRRAIRREKRRAKRSTATSDASLPGEYIAAPSTKDPGQHITKPLTMTPAKNIPKPMTTTSVKHISEPLAITPIKYIPKPTNITLAKHDRKSSMSAPVKHFPELSTMTPLEHVPKSSRITPVNHGRKSPVKTRLKHRSSRAMMSAGQYLLGQSTSTPVENIPKSSAFGQYIDEPTTTNKYDAESMIPVKYVPKPMTITLAKRDRNITPVKHTRKSSVKTRLAHVHTPSATSPGQHISRRPSTSTPVEHISKSSSFGHNIDEPTIAIKHGAKPLATTPVEHIGKPLVRTSVDNALAPSTTAPGQYIPKPTKITPVKHTRKSSVKTRLKHDHTPSSTSPGQHPGKHIPKPSAFGIDEPTTTTPVKHDPEPLITTSVEYISTSSTTSPGQNARNSLLKAPVGQTRKPSTPVEPISKKSVFTPERHTPTSPASTDIEILDKPSTKTKTIVVHIPKPSSKSQLDRVARPSTPSPKSWSGDGSSNARIARAKRVITASRRFQRQRGDLSERGKRAIARVHVVTRLKRRAGRTKQRRTTVAFLGTQMLAQLKLMFKNTLALRQRRSWKHLEVEEEVREYIRQLEAHVENSRGLDSNDFDFEEKLSRESHAFIDLNNTAITACIKLRSLYQSRK